jgi:hypothetical protein
MERTMSFTNGVNFVNGKGHQNHRTNGQTPTERLPRRIVLLTDSEQSAVSDVLLELHGTDITGKRLHTEIQSQAAAHPDCWVAAEWLGNLGWTRFLWCKK